MIYKFKKIASNNSLPLNLEEVKDFLKITGSEEDKLLKKIVKSVSDSFENYTGRVLLSRNMQMELKNHASSILIFPVQPVIKVNSVKLVDYYGNESAFDERFYILNNATSILHFKHVPLSHSILIDFDAGLGASSSELAEDLKIALLKHAAHLYVYRGGEKKFSLSHYRKFKILKI